jgi:transcriptional regulator with XRE-family HTH domain
MNFPRNLRYLRKKSGLKQEDMLDFLRITRSTWSNYEIGFSNPKLPEVVNISKFFGVTLDELVMQDLETQDPLPKKKGQRDAREYATPNTMSTAAEPGIAYVLQELSQLRDEVNKMKEKEK